MQKSPAKAGLFSVTNAVRHISKRFLKHPHPRDHKPTHYMKNKKSASNHVAIKSSLLLTALCLELKRARRVLGGPKCP